jgi:integrase
MRYQDVPQFMADLRRIDTVTARCLEFLILTSTRASEATGAIWDEFDLDAVRIDPDSNKKIPDPSWTIPAHRMKARREHRVPLSQPCVDLLRRLPHEVGSPLVFVGRRPGATLSKMSMAYVMDQLGQKGSVTIHGFRSTFRDWAGEDTSFAPDICEAALAHMRGDKSVRAYARGDLFNKRRRLMDSWAVYCASPPMKPDDKIDDKTDDKIVGIRSRRVAP